MMIIFLIEDNYLQKKYWIKFMHSIFFDSWDCRTRLRLVQPNFLFMKKVLLYALVAYVTILMSQIFFWNTRSH
jgi:hypothetical protein